MQNVKSYLRTRRVPLDLEGMTTLTPWLQRRLGWGDARTPPELLAALKEEARMRPRNLGELCGLLSARRDVAKAELRLRQPRTTADPPATQPSPPTWAILHSGRASSLETCSF